MSFFIFLIELISYYLWLNPLNWSKILTRSPVVDEPIQHLMLEEFQASG